MEDRELVQKLLAKDKEAERHFFHAYRDRLYKACSYVLGYQDPEIEDVTQETFMIALQSLGQFEFRSSLSTWLVRICMNRCHDRVRQRQRQIVKVVEELESLARSHSMEMERQKEAEEEQKRLVRLIAAQTEILGDPCRGVLKLRDEEGKSYAAIAGELRIPIGTVMSRLARCKEALKQLVLNALKEESNA